MATGVQTGNSFCLIEQLVMADGGGPCTHAYTQDEGLYVVSGHCTFHTWSLTIQAGPGELVTVPGYGQHAFSVDAPDMQLLNFYLPAGFELLLMGLAHPAERNELRPEGAVAMGQRTGLRTLPPAGWTPPGFPQGRRQELFAECGMMPLAL